MARTNTILSTTTITTAVTAVTTETINVPVGTKSITAQSIFDYGSGGTTLKLWFQTSFDGGTTWVDIMNHAYTTSDATKVTNVIAATAVAGSQAITDGSLADNTNVSGLIGTKVRLKYTSTGTYGGSTTIKADVHFNT